jgi:hypothetical protein
MTILAQVCALVRVQPTGYGCRTFNLQPPVTHHTFRAMFDIIRAELTTAADKLAHLRRFL